MHPKLSRHPLVLAGILAGYFALGQLGLAVGGFVGGAFAVWPSSGFAVAALLLVGRRAWPAVFAGAFFAFLLPMGHVLPAAVAASGHTCEAVLTAMLVERFARAERAFATPSTIFRFVAIAMGGSAVSATFGVAGSMVFGAHWLDVGYLWTNWWLASVAGMLVVTPLVLLWATTPVTRIRVIELTEAALILLVLGGICLVVFAGEFPSDVKTYPLEFLCVPVLLWAAFRQGRRTVAIATTVLSGLAVWGTARGFGPFLGNSRNEALVLVQAYVGVMSTMGAVLASVVAEHRHAEARLRELAITDSLTGLMNYRGLLEVLKAEIARSNRTGRSFAVLFLDMDGLKRINDKHGHLAGSRALCVIAETMRQSCRVIDTPARFGGDEFALVLPETHEAGGQVVLRRITDKLLKSGASPVVAISGGVAVFPRDGDSPTLLLRAADLLLYQAKARTAAVGKRALNRHDDHLKTGTLF